MSNTQKPSLGFSGSPSRAGALDAPLAATDEHMPHKMDNFSIESDEETDTATIFLSEVDAATGLILVKRQSVSIPLGMLADLVRQRPEKPSKLEAKL